MGDNATPKLYQELAEWWPLLSAPEEYAEEAAYFARLLRQACDGSASTLLELGSGGGNNASHLKAQFALTLVDRAPGMLTVSRALNPECEHIEGDMRDLRLGRTFDCVFVHDAVAYMTSETDLRKAMATAFAHCRPGGAAVFAPDHLRDNFAAATDHGGHDGATRSLRYLEWMWDPDPTDDTCVVDMVYALRHGDGRLQVEHDRHVEGLFARATWLRLLAEEGFQAQALPFEHSQLEPGAHEVFVALRPR